MVRLNHSLSERGWKFISSWIGKQPLYNLPNHKMEQPLKKQVSTILSMYEKEMVKYPYFKMIFSIEEANLHVRIKQRGQNHGLIYEEMVNMYMAQGLPKRDAMMKSRQVVCDFYEACDTLTKKWQTPFVAIISELDPEKVLNSNSNNHGREENLSEN